MRLKICVSLGWQLVWVTASALIMWPRHQVMNGFCSGLWSIFSPPCYEHIDFCSIQSAGVSNGDVVQGAFRVVKDEAKSTDWGGKRATAPGPPDPQEAWRGCSSVAIRAETTDQTSENSYTTMLMNQSIQVVYHTKFPLVSTSRGLCFHPCSFVCLSAGLHNNWSPQNIDGGQVI